jgi:hypothetical protein
VTSGGLGQAGLFVERLADAFERRVQEDADIGNRVPRDLGDLFVRKVFLKL